MMPTSTTIIVTLVSILLALAHASTAANQTTPLASTRLRGSSSPLHHPLLSPQAQQALDDEEKYRHILYQPLYNDTQWNPNNREQRDLLVGGEVTTPTWWMYWAYLGGCGASLIYEDVLLTAAHCNAGLNGALIGPYKIFRGLISGTTHPAYDPHTQAYDLMVIKLSSPVNWQQGTPVIYMRNAAFPQQHQALTTIGMGSLYEGGPTPGTTSLMHVNIQEIPFDTCQSWYGGRLRKMSMFCAGAYGGGKDSCAGDSGGPIVDARGYQVGVTSWGEGCGRAERPGVYARTSTSAVWLSQQICCKASNQPKWCQSISWSHACGHNTLVQPARRAPPAPGAPLEETLTLDERAEQTLTQMFEGTIPTPDYFNVNVDAMFGDLDANDKSNHGPSGQDHGLF